MDNLKTVVKQDLKFFIRDHTIVSSVNPVELLKRLEGLSPRNQKAQCKALAATGALTKGSRFRRCKHK